MLEVIYNDGLCCLGCIYKGSKDLREMVDGKRCSGWWEWIVGFEGIEELLGEGVLKNELEGQEVIVRGRVFTFMVFRGVQ